MRHKIIFFTLIIILLAACESKKIQLRVESNVPDAIVYINGQEAGKTPLDLEVPAGELKLEVKHKEFKPLEKVHTIGSQESEVITVELLSDFDLIYVKGGTFDMGCTAEQGDACRDDEKPVHKVTVSSFYLAKYEVSQNQWEAIMGSNPSNFENCEGCPVEKVSWNDIQNFLHKLNEKAGKNYRLPTEAEWEFAARGGLKSRKYKYAGADDIDSVGWHTGSANRTQAVGQKKPNELGLYDMSGNVWEWCADYKGAYNTASATDPKGPETGSYRILRGGGWYNEFEEARITYRDATLPDNRRYCSGFRVLLVP